MSQEREQEIRRQFLDEAQEYLSTLESAVLRTAGNRVDLSKVNAALRSAHSIKGGAGMMGFETLSTLAHRLEDSFKVLKTQKSLVVDAELECLLLSGVGCLRDVIDRDRTGFPVESHWVETQATPIFEALHDRLGDPQDEDAASILASEEGQDIAPLLFETEVEGCLQRLEVVLADPAQPCLREEVTILTQELGGLGEMLQLPAFTQLCYSIAHALETNPEDLVAIAQKALQAWRRTQALVLIGQRDLLPTTIADWVDGMPATGDQETAANPLPDSESVLSESLQSSTTADFKIKVEPASPASVVAEYETAVVLDDNEFNHRTVHYAVRTVPGMAPETEVKDYRILERPSHAESLGTTDDDAATVRVSVRQLNQLNDLLSELAIERNSLNLHLKRTRELSRSLNQRVQALKLKHNELRTAYDKATPSNAVSPAASPLPHPHLLPPAGTTVPYARSFDFDILELDRYDDQHLLFQQLVEMLVQTQEVTNDIDLSLEDTDQAAHELNKTTKKLQTNVMHLRMRPLSDIVDRLPRAVRELSLQFGKPVQLILNGRNTLIDRSVLEALNDPLLHLIRNAFDHGIEDQETRQRWNKPETGTVEIQAFHQGSQTVITVRDDGGGIPLDKVRDRATQMGLDPTLLAAASDEELVSLIFEPGFSTASQVTALSGRGVGMDVVRDRLKQVRGDIKVTTQANQGTTFTLSVPYTPSIVRILLVESNHMLLAVPADVVEEITLLRSEDVMTTVSGDVLNWQGTVVRLLRFANWLQFNCPRQIQTLESQPLISTDAVLLTHYGKQLVGIQVDRCWNEQEVAVRRVEGKLPMPVGFTNCTILGDGRVVPLVNIPELLRWGMGREHPQAEEHPTETPRLLPGVNRPGLPAAPDQQPSLRTRNTILVIDDSTNVRRLLALTLERSNYEVVQAKDGQDAIEKLQAGLSVQVIICDIEMPRLDGYGFLAKVKANPAFQVIPIVMLTSRSSAKHQQLAMSLGATAYFSKPYNERSLLQTIEQLIAPELCVR